MHPACIPRDSDADAIVDDRRLARPEPFICVNASRRGVPTGLLALFSSYFGQASGCVFSFPILEKPERIVMEITDVTSARRVRLLWHHRHPVSESDTAGRHVLVGRSKLFRSILAVDTSLLSIGRSYPQRRWMIVIQVWIVCLDHMSGRKIIQGQDWTECPWWYGSLCPTSRGSPLAISHPVPCGTGRSHDAVHDHLCCVKPS